MYDPYADLDALIGEIDGARRVIGKIKTAQVRNAEQLVFFKTVALSWFQGRRSAAARAIPAEEMDAIDVPYQILLHATDKHSAKGTYVKALATAREALIRARAHALVPAPATRTEDSPPNFAPLASDPVMQQILERRWGECRRCIDAGASLAATVMMGGLLEALLVSRANKLSDKSKLFKARAAPIDPKTKKPLDLRQWTLGPYIDVGHELKWISRSAKDVAVILRDYRNYIHPEKERSHGIELSTDDAAMFWEVTKTLSRELLPGGHFKIPHPWPGQNPPPDGDGQRMITR